MAEVMKTIHVPATTSEVVDYLTCDLCGKRSADYRNWSSEMYHQHETTIRLNHSMVYPDGGDGHEISADICPDCFANKLIPWLEEQGARLRKTETDW